MFFAVDSDGDDGKVTTVRVFFSGFTAFPVNLLISGSQILGLCAIVAQGPFGTFVNVWAREHLAMFKLVSCLRIPCKTFVNR